MLGNKHTKIQRTPTESTRYSRNVCPNISPIALNKTTGTNIDIDRAMKKFFIIPQTLT